MTLNAFWNQKMALVNPTLEACLERFIKFGECICLYKKWVTPFKCDVDILTCLVCTKHHGKRIHSN